MLARLPRPTTLPFSSHLSHPLRRYRCLVGWGFSVSFACLRLCLCARGGYPFISHSENWAHQFPVHISRQNGAVRPSVRPLLESIVAKGEKGRFGRRRRQRRSPPPPMACGPSRGCGDRLSLASRRGSGNEHGTIYTISSDFGDHMTTQLM